MALDPREIVSDLAERAHDPDGQPPAMLSRPVRDDPRPPPLRPGPEVSGMHQAWAGADDTSGQSGATGQGLRGALRARAETVMATALGPAQRRDRALVGSVIQAVDAVAGRCDELADRVVELEAVVGEVVDVLGAELTRLRAMLGAVQGPAQPSPGPTAERRPEPEPVERDG